MNDLFIRITRSISKAQTQSSSFQPNASDMIIASILLVGLIIFLILLILLSRYLKKTKRVGENR